MGIWEIIKRLITIGFITAVVLLVVYILFMRPYIFRMGATDEEVRLEMPGDGMVASANSKYTQAITIDAPKDIVYAYIIQMGYKRGGWYNLDFINRMAAPDYFYENDKSADRIIPEFQNIMQGDKISIVPQLTFDVHELKKDDHMLLAAFEGEKCVVTWSYQLSEIDKDTTRLRVRWASYQEGGLLLKLFNYFIIDFGGSGVQQRLNLKGIKSRAEAAYTAIK